MTAGSFDGLTLADSRTILYLIFFISGKVGGWQNKAATLGDIGNPLEIHAQPYLDATKKYGGTGE